MTDYEYAADNVQCGACSSTIRPLDADGYCPDCSLAADPEMDCMACGAAGTCRGTPFCDGCRDDVVISLADDDADSCGLCGGQLSGESTLYCPPCHAATIQEATDEYRRELLPLMKPGRWNGEKSTRTPVSILENR